MTKIFGTSSKKYFFISLLVSSLLSILAAFQAYQSSIEYNEKELKTSLNKRLDDLKDDVKAHFEQYNNGVIALRSAMYTVGVNHFRGQQMKAYFDSVDFNRDYPGALGIGFIRWVKEGTLNNYLSDENTNNLYPVTIRSLSDHQGDHFIIRYVLPYESNKQAIGLDIASERNRRMAAIKAFSLNTTQLTEPITLVQDNNKTSYGFLILTPVYSAPSGKKQPYGWTYSPLIVSDVLKNLNLHDVSVSLYETLQNKDTPFFSTMTKQEASSDQYTTGQLDLYGRTWEIHMYPKASFYKKVLSTSTMKNGVISFILTFSSFMLIYLIIRLFSQKKEITREINQLKAIFKSVSGSIIVVNKDLKIISSNRKETGIFDEELIIGKSIFYYIKKIGDASSVVIFNRIQNEMKAYSNQLLIGTTHHCQININPIIDRESFSGAIIYIEQVEAFEITPNDIDFPIVLINKDKVIIQENTAFTQNKDALEINTHAFMRQLNDQDKGLSTDSHTIITSHYKSHYLLFFIPHKKENKNIINNFPTATRQNEEQKSTLSTLSQKKTDNTSNNAPSSQVKEVDSQHNSTSIHDTYNNYLSILSSHGIELNSDDLNDALSRFLDSFDSYLEALHSFMKEMVIALPHLNEYDPLASKTLHSLKGGFSTFGFSSLAEQAKALETMIKKAPDNFSVEIKEKVVLFTSQCQQLNHALHEYYESIPTNKKTHNENSHPQDEEADVDVVEELILLLQLVEHCNLRSLDVYKNIRPHLALLDSSGNHQPFPEIHKLDDAMEKMDFEYAEELISLMIENTP